MFVRTAGCSFDGNRPFPVTLLRISRSLPASERRFKRQRPQVLPNNASSSKFTTSQKHQQLAPGNL